MAAEYPVYSKQPFSKQASPSSTILHTHDDFQGTQLKNHSVTHSTGLDTDKYWIALLLVAGPGNNILLTFSGFIAK